jgi:hypothetical protein
MSVMSDAPTSRRTILRSGLLAVGALAGLVGLGRIVARPQLGMAVQAPTGLTEIKLYGREWSMSAPGLRRGDLPTRGQQVSVTGILATTLEGEPAGAFFATVAHLDNATDHGPFASVQMESHTFQLGDGALIGMGSTTPGERGVFAVVGGTGRYLGATGSYVALQNPVEIGGDGTAEFTFTLNSGR